MTDQLNGRNGHVYIVSAARTPIGKFGGALVGHAGGRAGRRGDPGRGRARRPARGDADRRGPHGPGPPGRRRPGAGPPGGAAGRPARTDERDDDQPRLWLRAEVDHARRRGDPGGRRRDRRRGRHGDHEPGARTCCAKRGSATGSATTSWSTRPSPTACGARSRTATWAPTPSASRSATTSAARTRTRSRSRRTSGRSRRSTPAASTTSSCPSTVRDAKGRETVVGVDENPRRDSTAEALARLKPAFALPDGADRGDATTGTVTAGNAPGITDGAAATIVASERAVERLGLKPLARIVGYAQAEVEPKWLFLAPIQGVRRLLDRIELPIEAFDLIEINEAFAAQVLADGRELGFDWDKVNVNGGAIALGHPIGASGARVVATLLHELNRREGRYGLATLCLGGGGSVAAAFERVQ